jgi:hypothetical protein
MMIPAVDSLSSVRERSEIREGFHPAPLGRPRQRWWCALVLGCTCLCPVRALAISWVELATTPTGLEAYFDAESFERINAELIQITVKWVHSEASRRRTIELRRQSRLSVDGYEDLTYSLSTPVLDCWGKQTRSTGFVDYNSAGKEIGRLAQTSTWVPWARSESATPDQELCRKFSNR